MNITILLENSKKDERFRCNHGLSVYIEANGNRILLDTGQDDSFIYNANLLGIDIKEVDFAVISHFHYDHTGGLKSFLKKNTTAKVYIGKDAFDGFYAKEDKKMNSIGIDAKHYDIDQFVFVDETFEVSKGNHIVSKMGYKFDNPLNDKFYRKTGELCEKDDFSHETALVISEGTDSTLVSGCFHSGVINSVEKANMIGRDITAVVGGFHLSGSNGKRVSDEYFSNLADYFKENQIKGYTGHCTGERFAKKLLEKLPGLINPIFTGAKFTI